ncbi:HAMP domain-containing sensor histidine kinase [Leptolyngbya sp. UWPOB_LEPTO1]|uniref:sensor histidine kinase n=1 Tax=Leptolyngbya sp. UWPOB_LEPTO1 TaxID=2815653 RepID=UPI002579EF1F|nr:HAMP domain-containing sensor histidine kinase [Leptolyngbya sp. UWPOB_LEPTO1]
MVQDLSYPNPDLEIQAEIDEIGLDFLEEDLQKLLKSIRSGAERVRQIVLALRNFSRLDETGMKPVDLHQGLDNTLLILQNRLQSKKGLPAIQVFHQYGELPLVNCDASQLNQVFINILSNAIDAIETRLQVSTTFVPTITITTKQQGGAIVIYIQDNGVGMMPEVMQRLFEPFFTTKPVGQGTGLGLSVSYQIIEKHGGTIRVTSELGQGSQFAIILPIKEPLDSQKQNLAIRSEN